METVDGCVPSLGSAPKSNDDERVNVPGWITNPTSSEFERMRLIVEQTVLMLQAKYPELSTPVARQFAHEMIRQRRRDPE
jgi:hypothetical protein